MFSNLLQFIQSVPTEKDCREYVAKQRWEGGKAVCPFCGHTKCYVIEGGKRYKCGSSSCYKKFSVTVGTIMEDSKIPLTKWLVGIYLVTAHKKGISSYQLGRDLGIAQKNSWFMLHRIREMLKKVGAQQMEGIVEVDETYMGRKYRSDFKGLPEPQITEAMKGNKKNRGGVIGLANRKGDVLAVVVDEVNAEKAKAQIKKHVVPGSKVFTDQSSLYRKGLEEYIHESVRHTLPTPEWVRGEVHTNNIEGFWGFMKRGIYGIYHQVSYKHLQAYCDEFSYRYNTRKMTDANRFNESLRKLEGRLTYKQLVNGKSNQETA